MDSPSKLEDRTQLPIAWNSFGQSAWAREPNGKDKFLLPAEPEKVGVGMMFITNGAIAVLVAMRSILINLISEYQQTLCDTPYHVIYPPD